MSPLPHSAGAGGPGRGGKTDEQKIRLVVVRHAVAGAGDEAPARPRPRQEVRLLLDHLVDGEGRAARRRGKGLSGQGQIG